MNFSLAPLVGDGRIETTPICERMDKAVGEAGSREPRIHQEITDLLHYQSHVRLAAASHLPPGTRSANQQEREVIIEFLKEERTRIWTLRALLDMAENNDIELQGLYEDSPVTADEDWGTFAWGPMPQWEEPPPADDPADDMPPA
jgi:hypothetical protein